MKKSTVIIMWGAITAITATLYYELLIYTDHADGGLQLLMLGILFAGLFLGMKNFRDKSNGGYASYGQLYMIGLYMALVIIPVKLIQGFLLPKIHMEYIQNLLDNARAVLIVRGVKDDQIELLTKGTRWSYLTTSGIIFTAIFRTLISVLLVGLIPAGMLAKAKPFMEEDNNSLPA